MKHETYYKNFIENNLYPRQLKSLETTQGFSSIYLQKNGKKLINFSASDYLGLANHPLLIERSSEYVKQYGIGSSASRLVTGNFSCYTELENQLAKALNKPAALILGSGYQTNFTVLEALLDRRVLDHDPLIFCDKLCHNSLYTSIKSHRYLKRFRHNDLEHLRILLEKSGNTDQQKFILVESVYSMEGDETNLPALIALAEEHQAFLYVDDAHAVGVYGEQGWGKAAEYADSIPMIMGTFSKALGSFGGFIACSTVLKEFLVNKCAGLIYSTGLSPAVLGAISAVIDLLPQLNEERARVRNYAEQVRHFFRQEGIDYGASTTHIVPWIIGDAKKTLQISEQLEQQGILGAAIQPPTVPYGKSRIRFSFSAAHSQADIDQLIQAIKIFLF